jgi:hypothetical protein
MSGTNTTGATVPTYGQNQQRPPPELLAFNDPIAQPPETDQTSRASTVPWGPIQPYMVEGYAQALDQYMRPREFYPGETYVPFSQQTEAGLQAQEGRAMTGNPLLPEAQNAVSNIMGGAYSDPRLQAGASLEAGNTLGKYWLSGRDPAYQALAQFSDPALQNAAENVAKKTLNESYLRGDNRAYQALAQFSDPALQNAAERQAQATLGNTYLRGQDPGFTRLAQFSDPALQNAAERQAQATIRGDYLRADNPAFQAMADRIENEVRPGIDSQFAAAGRYGGAGHEEMMARTMSDALAPLAFQNYQTERAAQRDMAELGYQNAQAQQALNAQNYLNERAAQQAAMGLGYQNAQAQQALNFQNYLNERAAMQSATGLGYQNAQNQQALNFQNYRDERGRMADMTKLGYDNAQQARDAALRGSILAPGLANADYTDINKLLETGQAREGLGGRMLQSDIDRWNWQEAEPAQRLANYMNMLRGTGASGGFNTRTSTEAPGSDGNTAGNVLGTIATGTGILGDLFGKNDGIFRW